MSSKGEARKRIERAYQRAMNIRDSMQSDLTDAEEEAYSAAYRFAYRIGEVAGFRMATRKYLHNLRSLSKAFIVLDVLMPNQRLARWCPVCGRGRPSYPGAVQIRCSGCGVWSHCDNWNLQPNQRGESR